MKALPLILAILWMPSAHATAPAATDASTCGGIRSQIQAQTGILPAPDIDLLQKLSIHSGCRFSSSEVYRAAYGDKPVPRSNPSEHNRRGHDDDD